MGWLKNRQTRQREMEHAVGMGAVTRTMTRRAPRMVPKAPVLRAAMTPMRSPMTQASSTPQMAPAGMPSAIMPTGFYAPAQAPGGALATGPQAEGQSAATALVQSGDPWSLYAKALSAREKDLLDVHSENPWITRKYLSAIERLKRDEFGENLLAEEEALWNESYVNQFGFDANMQWAYDKAHGGTRWGPRSYGGGYDTFGGADKEAFFGMGRMAYRAVGKKPSAVRMGDLWNALRNSGLDEGSWQHDAFKHGFQYASAEALDDDDEMETIERIMSSSFGASRPSRYVPSERNALWWGRRGMNPPWEEGFGQDVVPHLCETEWGESDARCIQHLGDPYWSGR